MVSAALSTSDETFDVRASTKHADFRQHSEQAGESKSSATLSKMLQMVRAKSDSSSRDIAALSAEPYVLQEERDEYTEKNENILSASVQRSIVCGLHSTYQRSPLGTTVDLMSPASNQFTTNEFVTSPKLNPHDMSSLREFQLVPVEPPCLLNEKKEKRVSINEWASKTSSSVRELIKRDNEQLTSPRSISSSSQEKKKERKSLTNFTYALFRQRRKTDVAKQPEKEDVVENIGMKLALPSTMDIMTGKVPPPPPGWTRKDSRSKDDSHDESRDECHSHESTDETTTPDDAYIIRSSEIEPSHHQVSIPPAEGFLMHARICSLMESYSLLLRSSQSTDHMFDFGVLGGMSRIDLERMYTRITSSSQDIDYIPHTDESRSPTELRNKQVVMPHAGVQNEPHPSILKSLFECGKDIVVEGYFSGGICKSSGRFAGLGMEVAVFSSQCHRQFIVCYRGSSDQQLKPVNSKSAKHKEKAAGNMVLLHQSHPVPVHPGFRDCYFDKNLEKKVFAFVDKLAAKNPFCDVVMTGHSYGGALATIGAVRFAALYPMITVSCHVFGAPRVGGVAFRHLANSLPNLKVMRVENGADPYGCMPEGAKWMHAGHTVTLNEEITPIGATNDPGAAIVRYVAHAYRFDERRPVKQFFLSGMGSKKTKKMKRGQEIRSYVHSLERFTHLGHCWVSTFVGEEGMGINGLDDEERCVV